MKILNYFFQFFFIILLFILFKILGYRISNKLSGYLFLICGPIFRNNEISKNNLQKAFPKLSDVEIKKNIKKMWFSYGQILSEYVFIKDFKNKKNFKKRIHIENEFILENIKLSNKPVIFISGHFSNFELMAQQIELTGINLAAVYRPLNNKFLNPLMENIRKKYICRNQVKKGISGTKELLKFFKNNVSIALMIDQRVSEGIKSPFFNLDAYTTTIPAQFVKKFDAKVVPVHIFRTKKNHFNLKIHEPVIFNKNENIENITKNLNKILEKMIMSNPSQWIWTHNRWK
jgi:KDO2-lipid IV(A) lauroyltransferase